MKDEIAAVWLREIAVVRTRQPGGDSAGSRGVAEAGRLPTGIGGK